MKTLKARLQQGVKPCYWLSGEDYYLYDKAISMLKKAMGLCLEDFNLAVYDDDNFSMQQVVDCCEVMPLGGDKRCVILKNITKVSETDKKLLLSYLENPCPSTVLIVSDGYGQFTTLKGHAELVDCRRMDRNLARSIVVSALAKAGKQISPEGADTLLEYCSGYLTLAMNELDKLVYFDRTETLITRSLVEKLVSQNLEFTVFELTEALGKKNFDKAVTLAGKMEKEPGTIGLICNHFRRLFFIAISELSNAELAALLGVKEYAILRQRETVKNFSKMQLKKIFALLERIDYQIKSGQILSVNALYYLIFTIAFI